MVRIGPTGNRESRDSDNDDNSSSQSSREQDRRIVEERKKSRRRRSSTDSSSGLDSSSPSSKSSEKQDRKAVDAVKDSMNSEYENSNSPSSDSNRQTYSDIASAKNSVSGQPGGSSVQQGVEDQSSFEYQKQAKEFEQSVVEEYNLENTSQVAVEYSESENQLTARLTDTGKQVRAEQLAEERRNAMEGIGIGSEPAENPTPTNTTGSFIDTSKDGSGVVRADRSMNTSGTFVNTNKSGEGVARDLGQGTQEEQFGDFSITNPATGNRVEDDLQNASQTFQAFSAAFGATAASGYAPPGAFGNGPASGLVKASRIERNTLNTLDELGFSEEVTQVRDLTPGSGGVVQDFTQSYIAGSTNALDPFGAASDAKEAAEFAIDTPGRLTTKKKRNELASDVEDRGESIAAAVVQQAKTNPTGLAGGSAGGLIASAGVGSLAAPAIARASGGRLSGSDLSGRIAQRTGRAVDNFLNDDRGTLQTGKQRGGGSDSSSSSSSTSSSETVTLDSSTISSKRATSDISRGGRFGDGGPANAGGIRTRDRNNAAIEKRRRQSLSGGESFSLGYRSAETELGTRYVDDALDRKAEAEVSSLTGGSSLAGTSGLLAGVGAETASALFSGARERERQAQQTSVSIGNDLVTTTEVGPRSRSGTRSFLDTDGVTRAGVDIDTRVDVDTRTDLGSRQDTDTRLNIASRSDVRQDADSRFDLGTRTPNKRRRSDFDLDVPEGDKSSGVFGNGGDEQRFLFETRSLLGGSSSSKSKKKKKSTSSRINDAFGGSGGGSLF